MKITQTNWGVVIGETKGQPSESIKRLTALASRHKGIYMGAARYPDGKIAYDADWSVDPSDGLKAKPRFDPPQDVECIRLAVLFNPLLFINKETWKFLGGLPNLPNGDAYGIIALTLKAYFSGIKMRCCTLPVCNIIPSPTQSFLNAHFVHRAYFSDEVYQHVWAPMLLHKGYSSEIDVVLRSEDLQREIRWLQEHRKVQEEIFFRKTLLRDLSGNFKIDEQAGRAMPSNAAAYMGFEARRSPGREWYKDKSRIDRHTNTLMGYLFGQNVDPSQLRLLDLGSRDGHYLMDLLHRGFSPGSVMGIELSIWAAKHAREQGRPVTYGDAHDLSRWEDGSFGIATSWHNLEHCHSPLIVLKEVHRVLKSDGVLMVVVPLEEKGLSLKGDHCHAFRSAQHVIQLAQVAGFECVNLSQRRMEFTGFFVKAKRELR